MKTRENELHEIKIETKTYEVQGIIFNDLIEITVHCCRCGEKIYSYVCHDKNNGLSFVKEKGCPNYCPNCGARLKEIR